MNQVLSKTEFARLKQRSPACVTKWIKSGKISKAALVNVDAHEKILVGQAERDLSVSLDPAQQFAQAVPAISSSSTPRTVGDLQQFAAPLTEQTGADPDDDLARKRKADADRSEEEAISARRRNAIEDGKWVDAAEAAKSWNRQTTEMLADVETFLTNDLARAVAEDHGLDWKATSIKFRNRFRTHRMDVADKLKERREKLQAELVQATE